MLNFMRNDILIQKNYLYFFIPFIIVLIILNLPSSFVLFTIMGYIPMNAVYLDSQSNSNRLFVSLPYTRKEIVFFRYLNTILYSLVFGSLIYTIYLFLPETITALDMSLGISMLLLFASVFYPLYYYFNSQKAMLIMFYGFLIVFGIAIVFINVIISNPYFNLEYLPLMLNIILGISVVTYICSWLLSTKLFLNKDL